MEERERGERAKHVFFIIVCVCKLSIVVNWPRRVVLVVDGVFFFCFLNAVELQLRALWASKI